MTLRQTAPCPTVATIKLLANQTNMITIRYLRDSPMRFNELKRVMGNSSSKTLSRSLKHLTREGIVCRRVIDTTPVGVEYSLTKRGQELSDAIYELRRWGRKWLMSQNQQAEPSLSASNGRLDRQALSLEISAKARR